MTIISALRKDYDDTGAIDLNALQEQEVRIIEDAIAEHELDQLGGGTVIARRTIAGSRGGTLCFEAFIEDDGECIDLKTPYDERDGKFADLSECRTEEW